MYVCVGAPGIHQLADMIAADMYYALAVPLLLPTATFFMCFNWIGLQKYRSVTVMDAQSNDSKVFRM